MVTKQQKNQLYQLYGDPHREIAAYRKEIKHWPQVKHEDAEGYRRFLNFLLKCETITQMHVLDTPEVMCRLLSKLATWWYKGQMVKESAGDQKKTEKRSRVG